MMPEKFQSRLAHPEDYFIEASIDGTYDDKIVDAIMDEINAIVDGNVPQGGVVRVLAVEK
jgi:hypothetical protein